MWGRCTQKIVGNKTYVYLHVIDWPEDQQLLFRLYEKAISAKLLHNGQTLKFKTPMMAFTLIFRNTLQTSMCR